MEDGDGIKKKFIINDLYKNEDEKKPNDNCIIKPNKLNGDLSSGSQEGVCCDDNDDDDEDDDEENSSSSSSADSDELVIDQDIDNNSIIINKQTETTPVAHVDDETKVIRTETDEIITSECVNNNNDDGVDSINVLDVQQETEKNINEYRNMVSNILKRKLCNDVTDENNETISDGEKSPEYKKMLLSSDLLPPSDLFNSVPDDILTINNNNNNNNNNSSSNAITEVVKQKKSLIQPMTTGTSTITNSIDYSNLDDYSILKEQLTKSGLQPAVKFKCFKCFESNFSSLGQLKDHQVSCLVNPVTHHDNMPETIRTTNDISKSGNETDTEHQRINNITTKPLHPKLNSNNVSDQHQQQQQQQSSRPDPSTKIRITRKVFLCSACGTYYENWNLFLHMREVHRRHICLLCLGIFPSVDRLIHHLQGKHKLCEKQYENRESLLKSFKDPCYLMCCSCEHVFTEHDNFTKHLCENYMQPCILCGLKATHKPSCKGAVNAAVKNKSKDRDKLTSDINKKKLNNNNNSNNHDVVGSNIKLNNHVQNVNVNGNGNDHDNGGRVISDECNSRVASNEHITSNSSSLSTKNNNIILNNNNNNNNDSLNISNNNNNNNSSPIDKLILNHNDKNNSLYHQDNDKSVNEENRNGYSIKNNFQVKSKDIRSDTNLIQKCPNIDENDVDKQHQQVPSVHESDSDDSSNKMEICTSDREETNSSHHHHHNRIQKNNLLVNSLQNENCANNTTTITTTTETKSDHSSDEESVVSLSPEHVVNNNEKDVGGEGEDEEVDEENDDNEQDETEIIDDNQKDNKYKHLNGDLLPHNDLSDVTIRHEKAEENIKPLLVPKLKVRIPKVFTPIESEESSTESDDDTDELKLTPPHDDEDEEEDDEAQIPANVNNQSVDEVDHHTSNNDSEIREDCEVENHDDGGHVETPKELENDLNKTDPDNSSNDQIKETFPNKENGELETSTETNNSDNMDLEESNAEDKLKILNVPIVEKDDVEEEISVAGEDTPTLDLSLEQPLDRIAICDFLRVCLIATIPSCLYCNHARKIAVNAKGLAIHFITVHRFSATVDSITAEELLPNTIVSKLKNSLEDLDDIYLNLATYDSSDKTRVVIYDKIYECFQCRFVTKIHKELYLHNRKMHMKTILLCIMCKLNFYSYSELLCHRCPGILNKLIVIDITFRCCLCSVDNIQSAFRLMVHLRKKHFACDVCLEECFDQSRLSNHVWKHKLHHLCYRCGIAYRNKPDITKHLFWKHGTESVVCKKCLQKKWPHVYHFCIPPSSFICDVCNLSFSRAVSLKVHKRLHSGDAPYPCTEDNCDNKFISRKLLLKHVKNKHTEPLIQAPPPSLPAIVQPLSPMHDAKQSIEFVIKQEKIELETEEEHVDKVKDASDVTPSDSETPVKKSKKKKSKHTKDTESKKNIIDLMDLPAPNLSESDSSDDSEAEKKLLLEEKSKTLLSQIDSLTFARPAAIGDSVVDEEHKPVPIIDIWENFKSYQASQTNSQSFDDMDDEENYMQPIIHVSQSDHDYCLMYKKIILEKIIKEDDEADIKEVNVLEEIKQEVKEVIPKEVVPKKEISPIVETTPKKKVEKSPKKARKSSSDSSSDSSGSSSSSCSCGSNCSCSSSSSGSSSSSSSSDDSDSSSSESRKQIATKKEQKIVKERLKSENSVKSNNTTAEIIVDVVATTDKSGNIETGDTSSFIYESDLETEESETDEDFYDEHPQKMANELLAEKRKQLLMQTCMNPHSNSIVENSRPSTPSLPEEIVKEKRVKVKKRKKDRKSAKGAIIPPLKLNIPAKLDNFDLNTTPIIPSLKLSITNPNGPSFTPIPDVYQMPACSTPCNVIPSTVTPLSIKHLSTKGRLSSGTNSESDVSVKRSKRRRIPNKFYGYSSDEESSHSIKTVPPLNLTWKKEDLPSPSFVRQSPSIKPPIKSPALSGYKTTVAEYKKPICPSIVSTPTPVLPPVIIRTPPVIQPYVQQQPPQVVEPQRVPAVPVHHINPPIIPLPCSDKSSDSSDSDSSEEGTLQILQTPISTKTKPTIKIKPPIKPQTVPPIILNSNRIVNSGIEGRGVGGSVGPARITKSNTTPVARPNKLTAMQRPPYPQFPILPPAGSRPAREGESVYCYCRCPYDEVSEMIACDGQNCVIEWFHFECVGIMVPPKGKWYCPDCRLKHSLSGGPTDGTPEDLTGDT